MTGKGRLASLADDRELAILAEWLRLASISGSPDHREEVIRAAEYLAKLLGEACADDVDIIQTAGSPVVYAEFRANTDAPTLLIYGHYDVKPVLSLEKWASPPFTPVVRDGYIWARGATDDKGQVLAHVLAVRSCKSSRRGLPITVKFLIEGEEEIGSPHLAGVIEQNRERLRCDGIVISDSAMYSPRHPTICVGLRGIASFDVTVRAFPRPLHSGVFGGAVENPAVVLAHLVGSLRDAATGKVLVDGFYDDVGPIGEEEREEWRRLPDPEGNVLRDTDALGLTGEVGFSVLERMWGRPALDVNGIHSGYAGGGRMTVVPSDATAKVSVRLVPTQSSAGVSAKVRDHLVRVAPRTVSLIFEDHAGVEPWVAPSRGALIEACRRALEVGFRARPTLVRSGGTLPAVHLLARQLEAPLALMGLGLLDDGAHGPNERFSVVNFKAGIRTVQALLPAFAEEFNRHARPQSIGS